MDYDKKDLYVAIPWPNFESLKDEEGYSENCYLATEEPFDGSFCFVNVYWLEHINN